MQVSKKSRQDHAHEVKCWSGTIRQKDQELAAEINWYVLHYLYLSIEGPLRRQYLAGTASRVITAKALGTLFQGPADPVRSIPTPDPMRSLFRICTRSFTTIPRRLAPASPALLAIPSLDHESDHALARAWLDGFKEGDIPKTAWEAGYSRSSGPGGQVRHKFTLTVKL